jgi:hypothetical protein
MVLKGRSTRLVDSDAGAVSREIYLDQIVMLAKSLTNVF